MKPVTISETADRKYWIKAYEFEGMEAEAKAVALMPNGDIVVAGSIKPKKENTKSNGLVARLDKEGNVKWVRILGGSKDDKFNDVKIALNGDIIIVGSTESFGAGKSDVWVLRFDENGNVKWQKTYGGSDYDEANAVTIAENEDIIVAGYTWSFSTGWNCDIWVLRLDSEGNIKWQKTFGGNKDDFANSIVLAPNGDLIVIGYTYSFGAKTLDAWILRLNSNGNIKWQKTYGGGNQDEASMAVVTPSGDIIVAGHTGSFGAGKWDSWVLCLDENGNVKWQKTYGGNNYDVANAIALAPNNDIIIAGHTGSFGAGKGNVWVLRLDENGNVIWQKTYGGSDYDEANAVTIAENGDIIVAGYTRSFGDDVWILRLPPDGNLPSCKLCQDSNAIVMDTNAVVKNTKCKVTVPPLKPGFFRKEYVKITNTTATIRTAIPKVKILCEWEPEGRLSLSPSARKVEVEDNISSALLFRYESLEFLGEGGFARVYKAKRKDGKVVAVKIPISLDPTTGKSFLREIGNWTKLKHPNIVRVYDYNILPIPFFEMEYCESSLEKLPKPLPVEVASYIVFNIAEGLKYAHSKGIIHGNLKPSNILLKDGTPKISDWGLSKVVTESDSTITSFTPLYAAPEQINRRFGSIDERTDIWQLGVIFYELVTGRLPFEGSLSEVLHGILSKKPTSPSQINPKAKKVEPIIMKMLEKDKSKRYQSVEELQRDLARILNLTYSESLRKSKGDVGRITFYLTELLLINLKTNNAREAYKYASDLVFYTRGELKQEVEKLVEQIKFRLKDGLTIPPEIIEKAEIITHKIRLGYKNVNELLKDLENVPKRIEVEGIKETEVIHPQKQKSIKKPCPGYLINNRCYIVKAMVMDEAGLKSALEELDKELSSIDFIQPLPDEITVHPFKDIIEGENLFVTRNIVSRGPGESGIIPSEWLIEILDWIKKAVIPEIEVPERVAEAFAQSLPEARAEKPEVKAKLDEAIKSKPAKETKTVEGFPSALLSRYEPLEFLGEGGFAKVFKARRKEDGKIVALKIPRIDEKTSGLFIKEVAAWYNLNHENIVRLYRADILPVPYLEMEFIEGVEVDGKLVRDLEKYPKPVDEKTALKLITDIARGLAHAHSKGIYHLDLKPLNVLLKADLTPKITDWGLAKISARSSLSRHYGYSPLYAAPEQLDEETFGEPDHRTDIYQLGLILYEFLTGELPYRATSPGALVGKILYAKPKPISELKPGLKRFDGVFEKLLAKRKEERYQSVEEFLSALESLTELEREKEELRKTSLAMKKSRSREEFERLRIESIRKTVKIAILSAKLNDKAELLAALDDLKFYTRENLDDLLSAIAQVELLLKEGIPIGPEVEEKVRALVLRIEGEALSK